MHRASRTTAATRWRRLIAARAGTLADLFVRRVQPGDADRRREILRAVPAAKRCRTDFAALDIPLTVMATDLHRRAAKRRCRPGRCSRRSPPRSRIPGLLRPVAIDGRVLIDGGATNPLPFDQLARPRRRRRRGRCLRRAGRASATTCPSPGKALFTTRAGHGHAIIAAKLRHAAPDLMIRPNVGIFRTLDFSRRARSCAPPSRSRTK